MCGRKYSKEELNWAEYREALDIIGASDSGPPADNFQPNYNIAPTHMVPVARYIDGTRTLERVQWGLIPHWVANDPGAAKIGYKMINARSETVAEKASFKNLLQSHRCVIPVSGFYEWQRKLGPKGKDKQAHKVERGDGGTMMLAGLWTHHAGLNIDSYTLITTPATPAFEPIHNRLPVMLERDEIGCWLEADWKEAQGLMNIYQGPLTVTPVSNEVGNVANNYPELLEPAATQRTLI